MNFKIAKSIYSTLILILWILSTILHADVVKKNYYLSAPTIETQTDGTNLLYFKHSYQIGQVGEPTIPVQPISILLPPGRVAGRFLRNLTIISFRFRGGYGFRCQGAPMAHSRGSVTEEQRRQRKEDPAKIGKLLSGGFLAVHNDEALRLTNIAGGQHPCIHTRRQGIGQGPVKGVISR